MLVVVVAADLVVDVVVAVVVVVGFVVAYSDVSGFVVGNSGTNNFFHFLWGRGVLWLLVEYLLLQNVWLGETENYSLRGQYLLLQLE